MHYIRTTMQPHTIICVTDADYLDYVLQGLIYAEESGDEPSLPQLKAGTKSATDKKGA